jgi:DNA helicase-2/ATP-dependent DNA helicase PcrA
VLDLSRLSPTQRRAVLAPDGPLLIVAGPGSGKTTVLAARVAYLVAARGVPPTSVLVLTFATKAARELRLRMGGVVGPSGRAVDVATFHAFGLRVVRQWAEALGWGPDPPVVYGDEEARGALREVAAGLGVDLDRWPLPELAARLERHRLACGRPAAPSGTGPPPDLLGALAEAYEGLLRRRGAVDYPAMLALPLRLFEARPDALRLLQDAYRHVLVDEYQDVCAAQYALLRRLAERHRNLAVVGDPRQALYGWRGADVRFLRAFERDFPEARLVSLDENFRATGRLVDLANALGAGLAYGYGGPLRTTNPPGEPARLHVATDEASEAEFVAAEVAGLRAAGAVRRLGEVAVLFRTNRQADHLAVALRARRLPYRVRGNGDLFSRREVRDAVAYLRLAHNPGDATALARVVNTPPRRLGRLAAVLRTRPVPAAELPGLAEREGPAAAAAARALVAVLDRLRDESARLAPGELLELVLERTGYRAWLAEQPDGPASLGHLAALRELAEGVEGTEGGLGAWLADLQLGEEASVGPDEAERVLLTTIHGAKGAEWPVVFVIGVEEGLLPHRRAVVAEPTVRGAVEEELRVAYVAVTRPRERLYLTCCRNRRRGERSVPRRPSRFLRGLPLAVEPAA